MQNTIEKFRQRSTVSEKPGISPENLKTLTSSSYPTVQYFWWNFAHVFYLPVSTNGRVGYLNLGIELWIIWLVLPNYKNDSP